MSKLEENSLIDLSKIPTNPTRKSLRQKWIRKFTAYCDKIYEERGSISGVYCCGYHWCCNECYCKFAKGCRDCVATIEEILKKHHIAIDYSNYDFYEWEKLAYALYAKKKC